MRIPQGTLVTTSQPSTQASIIQRGFAGIGEQLERLENQVNRLTEMLAPIMAAVEKPPVSMTASEPFGRSMMSGNLTNITESLSTICCKLDKLLEQSEL